MVDPFRVGAVPKPADRSANKPIYIVLVEDPEEKGKIGRFVCKNIVFHPTHLDLKGFRLTKAQADNLRQNPNNKECADGELNNLLVPWHKIIRIENITYKVKKEAQNE